MVMKGRYRKLGFRFTVNLIEDYHDVLKAFDNKHEVSISWVLQIAIENYLRSFPSGVIGTIQAPAVTRCN